LMTLWNWNVVLVVILNVPLPCSSAIRSICNHCSGMQTP
jgi:hypothetical protein